MVLLVAVPVVGWIVGIAGAVMVLVAVYTISMATGEKKIYRQMRTGTIAAIGAVAVAAITAAGAIYAAFGGFHFPALPVQAFGAPGAPWMTNSTRFALGTLPHPLAFNPFSGMGVAIISGILVVWALLVVSAVFIRRSYRETARKLHISLFDTAGLLLLLGVALAIVGIGIVLIVIAEILLAISFFSIKEPAGVPASTTS